MAKKSTAPATTAAAAQTKVGDAAKTEVGVAAEFVVGTITIPISAADLANIEKNGLQFALPPGDVVKIGSIGEFIKALGELFEVPLSLPAKDQLKGLPFAQLFSEETLVITRLSLNTKKGDFAIAIGFYPDPAVPIMDSGPLSAIELKSLAFSVDRTGEEQAAG